jgi:collagenase-like PrtC family protease
MVNKIMKYSIGYQLPDEYDSLTEIVEDMGTHIDEIYFAWPGEASGRMPVGYGEEQNLSELEQIMIKELQAARNTGIGLVLLFNASCYGEDAISLAFEKKITALIQRLNEQLGLSAVTTTSPFVAKIVKKQFPAIKTRASVNLRIGTVKGMDYLSDCFDGYYIQRECNRDFERITHLRGWCNQNDKTLHLLANSGCMYACSNQMFHDNTVAHQGGLLGTENTNFDVSFCWDYISLRKNWVCFLQNTWIRPEDIQQYEPYFDTIKLATRTHANPRKVLSAYVRQRFDGNLPDLMEPSYSSAFKNYIIDNTRFPTNWFEKTSNCEHKCDQCDYCKTVLEDILVAVSSMEKRL